MRQIFLISALFLLAMPAVRAQDTSGPSPADSGSDVEAVQPDPEEQALRQGVRDANGSQVDIVRALEKHIARYPESRRREEIEYVLLKTAIDLDDDARIAKYGQLFLDTGANDTAVLDRVIPLLLRHPSEQMARRALAYAKRYEEAAQSIQDNKPAAQGLLYAWKRKRDHAFARAFVFQARALGNLGEFTEALKLARRSYDIEPSAESAREMGKWHTKLNQIDEAVARYADAFTIDDSRNDAAHRQQDRQRLKDLYARHHTTETGLGDLVLSAYDRTQKAVEAKRAELASLAPNAGAGKPSDFTLSALDGNPLPLASLNGKVVVVDFWATWCGPCRKQHPLYEDVKDRFSNRAEVVFLSVNTDEDRSVVQPFLEENHWPTPVYFEDGFAGFLRINSIPTTLVLGKDGAIFSRMNGFIPDTFVEQLSERVREALSLEPAGATAQGIPDQPVSDRTKDGAAR